MALTPMEQWKLDHYLKAVGRMTADEALEMALMSEDFASQVGPFDMAYAKFKNDQIEFFKYAELLEKENYHG